MSLTFSIIVPSYNQPDYIEFTCQNLAELKQKSLQHSVKIEVLLFDSCSNIATQEIIQKYKSIFDVLVIDFDT